MKLDDLFKMNYESKEKSFMTIKKFVSKTKHILKKIKNIYSTSWLNKKLSRKKEDLVNVDNRYVIDISLENYESFDIYCRKMSDLIFGIPEQRIYEEKLKERKTKLNSILNEKT